MPKRSLPPCRRAGRGGAKYFFGDAAYDCRTLTDKATFMDLMIEIVRTLEGQQGFAVWPRRWVAERTFGWLIQWRRLVRDYEQRIDILHNMVYLALGPTLLRRIFCP